MVKRILVTIFILSGVSLLGQIEKDTGYIVRIGDQAPDVRLELIDGRVFQLSDLAGKVVVLQFTASWCSVCRKEMPHLEKEVWLPNKDDDFILIGVDYDEPIEKVTAFKKQMKITYPMALDPGAKIFAQFANKNSGVTRNVVIDQQGRIAFLTRLFDRDEFDRMKEKIAELLNEKY
jgi:peroxiredoxin